MTDWSNWQDNISEDWNDFDPDPSGPGRFGSGLHPGVRSALIVSGVVLLISFINAFTAGTSVIFCYPVQLLIYVGNGALGAYFALNSGYDVYRLPRVGAVAGAVAWILPAAFYLIGSLVLGLFTLGVGFLGVAVWLLCGPVDLAIHVMCAMFGAWLYGRFSGGSSQKQEIFPY